MKNERLHDGPQPLRLLITLRIPTMHYILNEISYMSKIVAGYARYEKLPVNTLV